MNVQIFGFRDCQETRKALRFFAERRIAVHFVDMDEKPATRGELRRFVERLGAASLIDREGKRFRDLGLRVAGDSPERLLERALAEPRLLRTPLVRSGREVAAGPSPQTWQGWVDAERRAASSSTGLPEPGPRPAR
ncbi:MAG: arsenate reductase family protein [Candidatus Rokuibacteriota bacterium]